MLAQNFKTPAELKITDAEFDALYKVLGMLEREELKHVDFAKPEGPNGFNLGCFKNQTACGTVACIAGWSDLLFGTTFERQHSARTKGDPLINLFTPAKQDEVTTSQAAIGLRNFLTHGEARWAEALA